jgi:hypothetical protein
MRSINMDRMADSLPPGNAPQPPAFKIDLLSQIDVDYWCQIFHVSPEQLRQAVQRVGSQAVDVARDLRGRDSGDR